MLTNEDGTATIEFVLAIPVIMALFMASMESGIFMTRYIMLEKAVDMAMREVRLGSIPGPLSAAKLSKEICDRTIIMRDCESSITIEMTPISATDWAMPSLPAVCIDRDVPGMPSLEFTVGTAQQVMLVRACIIQNAIFPLSGIGLGLPKDGQGGYALVASSAFVFEPF